MLPFASQRMIPLFAVALGACSTSSGLADAGDAGPVYDGFFPTPCGATQDCVTAGLDADMCTYASTEGCSTTGQCKIITVSADCSGTEQEVCACSGGTLKIPPCWPNGLSPYPFSKVGACSLDGGS
jgi:hypothetical protein